jgi:hypothetical protein
MAWRDTHGLAARLSLPNSGTGLSPERVPLVICGPVLRRTGPEAVTVWVALKKARTVTLRVYSDAPLPFPTSLREELQGTRETVRLGENLHVVAVTARPVEAGRVLAPGTVYFYNLFFGPAGGAPVPESGDDLNDDDIVFIGSPTAPGDPNPTGLSYSFEHRLPSFSLPPSDLNKLRILHGSCRKPDGPGRDAMPVIDEIVGDAWPLADERPHLLLLNGDQIYADDVADTVLFLLMDADPALLGWSETLPGVSQTDVRLRPGQRKGIVRGDARLTTQDPEGHVLRMGEYFAMYLFSWSEALWPTEFPEYAEVKHKPLPVPQRPEDILIREGLLRSFGQEVDVLKDFRKTLREVRRAMANVPVYMMFDDHDVTDDWNMLREWCERIYANRLARRIVQNALVGYAVFQAWGNTPERFEAGQTGAALLGAVAAWSQAQGNDAVQAREIERRVGVPGTLSADGQLTNLFTPAGDFFRLARDPDQLRWDYAIRAPNLEILMLDTRTSREYTEDKAAPPALLGPTSLVEQIPLDDLDPNKLCLVVATTNVVTVPLFETTEIFGNKFICAWWYIVIYLITGLFRFAVRHRLGGFSLFNPDLSDSWQAQHKATEALFSRLGRRAALDAQGTRTNRVLLLSGDVHMSWAARMQYWADRPFDAPDTAEPVETIFGLLTSSAFKKEEPLLGNLFHRWGYIPMTDSMPAPLKWLGWREPSALGVSPHDIVRMSDWVHMEDWMQHRRPPMLAFRDAQTTPAFVPPPDWRYRIDFTLGQKSGVDFTLSLLEKPDPSDKDNWLKTFNEAQTRYRNYAQKWGDGIEIVGKNNLSELRVQWSGQTTLAAAVTASASSFTVAAPEALPAPPLFVRVGGEIVRVGDVDRGTGVCSKLARGQHTTQAAAHASGAAVEVFKTATQMHWWRLTGDTRLTPLTLYTISLEYLDPQFPKPKRPGEV